MLLRAKRMVGMGVGRMGVLVVMGHDRGHGDGDDRESCDVACTSRTWP